MKKRLNLKPAFTLLDKTIELIGLLALVFMWGIAIYYFFVLPNTIPVHFNAAGKPDGYGSKSTIFILPVTALFIFSIMTVLNKYPQTFNYPVKITAADAYKQYANGTRMIRFLKTAVLVVFTIILVGTCLTATGKSNGLGAWFLPLMLALILIPQVYFIARSYKVAK